MEKILFIRMLSRRNVNPEPVEVNSCEEFEVVEKTFTEAELLESPENLDIALATESPLVVLIGLNQNCISEISRFETNILKVTNGYPCLALLAKCTDCPVNQLIKYNFDEVCFSPFDDNEVLYKLEKMIFQYRSSDNVQLDLKQALGLNNIVCNSENFKSEIEKIPLIAGCDSTALVLGETGTGKELVAQAIHYLSDRSGGPFLAINCATIPEELADNELFGHEKGAYTNAGDQQIGIIQTAENGTLFLDDIDCLPTRVQAKLLRFLQEKEIRPIGSRSISRPNTRIIASMNAVLRNEIEKGDFRKDLFYRLNVLSINIPPLRERGNDVLDLAHYFRRQFADKYQKKIIGFSDHAKQKILSYSWPGNVRELKNQVEAAVLFSRRKIISSVDMGFAELEDEGIDSFKSAKSKVVNDFEVKYVTTLLSIFQGNISQASRAAQKNRRAFWELIKKHHINVDTFRDSSAFQLK